MQQTLQLRPENELDSLFAKWSELIKPESRHKLCDECVPSVGGESSKKDEFLMSNWASLVSNADLTAGVVEVWLGLPDEVKYDPSLEEFKEYYDKKLARKDSVSVKSRTKSITSMTKIQFLKDVAYLNARSSSLEDEERIDFVQPKPRKISLFTRARNLIKLTLLVACWMFFTIVFLTYGEEDEIPKHSSVMPGEIKSYFIDSNEDELRVLVKLEGPFLSNQFQKKLNCTDRSCVANMRVWLEKWYMLKNYAPENITMENTTATENVMEENLVTDNISETNAKKLLIFDENDDDNDFGSNFEANNFEKNNFKRNSFEKNNFKLNSFEKNNFKRNSFEKYNFKRNSFEKNNFKRSFDSYDDFEMYNTAARESELNNFRKNNIAAIQQSKHWVIVLDTEDKIDFTEGEIRSSILQLIANKSFSRNSSFETVFALRISCTSNVTTPFTLRLTMDPLSVPPGLLYSCLLLGALYFLIIFELVNRTMAALLVSTTSLAVLALAGERPSLEEMVNWLDSETLLLLFSMMVLVGITSETGLFDFLAVYAFEVTKGKIWPLISMLSGITAVLSTVLDNVTTILLMTPVTIRLCKVMDMDPVPILMWMVLFSNIGGTATPVGDPPNVIIASNKDVLHAGINFTNFTLHMTFGVILVCIQTYIQLRFIFRNTDKLRISEPRDILDLRRKIAVWKRAAESLLHSGDQMVVRDRLEWKIQRLTSHLNELVQQSKKRACTKDRFETVLEDIKSKYKIKDKVLLAKACGAIGFVVLIFFLHSRPEFNRVTLGWTALLGALLLLTLADRENMEPILHSIEWSTLLFFAALFVLMEALSKLGLIDFIGEMTEALIMQVNESSRLAVAIISLLWISGVASAFVDNIPLTTMMVRVVASLGNNPTLDLPMSPLIWALSFGACLGGNGTIIGASANVVCAGVAEQHGYRFTFMRFFKIGFPVMIGHLIVATFYLLFCHCVLVWH